MMKQNLLSLILASCLFISGSMAAPVLPVRTMEIPTAICEVPVMDGVAESEYSDVQTTEIFNSGGWDGEADFTAQFRVCYNPSYLYMLVQVTDDIDHSYDWGVGNPWEFDNIEVFLQLDTNTVTTSYNSTTIQLRVCRGLDSVETPGRAARTDYRYYMEPAAADGWIAELAIPWTAVLAEGAAPEDMMDYVNWDYAIGFDFMGSDSDNSDGNPDEGNRDVQSAWDMDNYNHPDEHLEDLAWNNTAVFGYVTLSMYGCHGSVDADMAEKVLNLYPNPAGESLFIMDLQKPARVECYNMQGVKVLSMECAPGQEIDISSLKSGMYSLVIDGQKSGRFTKY